MILLQDDFWHKYKKRHNLGLVMLRLVNNFTLHYPLGYNNNTNTTTTTTTTTTNNNNM